MNSFWQKCVADLKTPWSVAVIVVGAASLVALHERTGFRHALNMSWIEQLNAWLRVYHSLWYLSQLLFLFSIILGASGIGPELADRTARIWLLRPRRRIYFLTVFETVGWLAILGLTVLLVLYLLGARYFLGPPPDDFRSPVPLMGNIYLAAVTFFAVTRLLTYLLERTMLGTVASLGVFIGGEMLSHMLPNRIAPLVPVVRELADTGIVVSSKPVRYPFSLAVACLAVSGVCYGLEAWRFLRQDIRV